MRTIVLIMLLLTATLAFATDLDVMTFNIRYGTATDGVNKWSMRRDYVLASITTAGPDLLGTQECLAFQRDYLADTLQEYGVVATGRDDGDEGGEMCACFYRLDRFTLEDEGTFWLSETPDVVGSSGWDAALPRIATWLRLKDLRSDNEILWLNTHFDHVGEQARLESLKLIESWLEEHGGDAILVVTGDFNLPAKPGLLSGDVLQDTWTAVHGDTEPEEGTFNGFGLHPRPGRIDWVLVSKGMQVKDCRVDRTQYDGSWPSDHCPVIAVVDLD